MSNDLNRFYFGGTSSGGNAPTSVGTDWVSYTFARPQPRLAPNGQRLMIVKNLHFTVGGKGGKRKIYGRVSYPNGDPDASSSSTTINEQSSAKTGLNCTNLNFPMTDADGGPNMRVWIVTSSTFYFQRNTGGSGHIVGTKNKTFSGSPAGYMEYAEVPSAPSNVTAVRDADEPDRVTFSWSPEGDLGGGTLMGYTIETATDTGFSVNSQTYQVNGTSFIRSGYDPDTVYYVRVAALNEVSQQYNTNGLWSTAGTLPVYVAPSVPPDDTGNAPNPITYMQNDPTPSDPIVLQPAKTTFMRDAVRLAESGQWYVAQNSESGATPAVTISHLTTGGTPLDSMTLTGAGDGFTFALQQVSGSAYVWMSWAAPGSTGAANDLVRFKYQAGTFTRDTVPGRTTMPKFGSGYAAIAFDWLNGFCTIRRVLSASSESYELRKVSEYLAGVDATYGLIQLPINLPTSAGFATYIGSLFRWTGNVNGSDRATLTEYSWATGEMVAEFDGDNLGRQGNGTYPYNIGQPGGASIYNTDGTAPVIHVAKTMGDTAHRAYNAWAIPLLTQAAALQAAGYNNSSDAGGTDGTDNGGAASGSTGGSTGASGGSDAGTTPTQTVVYTPIPDTSSTLTVKGGLLVARAPRKSPGHTVLLMDRGGSRRLGQFVKPTSITYNRIRDDQSKATVTFSGSAIAQNQSTINKLAASRHEICIFRGDERVWEGPIVLPQWSRDTFTIQAIDITHYLNRTIMRNAYSNAPPNTDWAVARIAGIISAELARKEAIVPPVNVLPFLRTYIEDGDARTGRVTDAWTQYVWAHLDDMAAKSGIDYTVIGRALHIWDTSRAALGRTRIITEQDFLGDTQITAYGMETATITGVSDGQGRWGTAGGLDPFYGEIEYLSTAYDEDADSSTVSNDDTTVITQGELDSQAKRSLYGRNPVPMGLHVPDNSAFDLTRGLALDVLIPGVFMPVQATLAGKTLSQVMKLKEVVVTQDNTGESATISLTPASATDIELDVDDDA